MSILKDISSYILKKSVKTVLVIEIIEIRENETSNIYFNSLHLKREKKNILLDKRILQEDISILDTHLSEKKLTQTPILLVINSDKLYHKILSGVNESEILNAIFPGAKAEEFLHQSYQFSDPTIFASATRKTYIENILTYFKDHRSRIIKLFLGPASIFETYNLLFKSDKNGVSLVQFANYHFNIKNDILQDFKISKFQKKTSEEQKLYFGLQEVESQLIVPFSYGLLYFINPLNQVHSDFEKINDNCEAYNFNILSKPILILSTAILFSGLVLSSYLFTSYSAKNQQLDFKKQSQIKAQERYSQKDSLASQRSEILKQNGMAMPSKISYYADEITSALPDDMYIYRLEINPINNRYTDEKNTSFFNNLIIVKGNCYSSEDLNEWIKSIKGFPWAKKITIREFVQNNENELGNFSIEITKE